MTTLKKLGPALVLVLLLQSVGLADEDCVVPLSLNGQALVTVTALSRQRCIDEAFIAGPQPAGLTPATMKEGPVGSNAIRYDQPLYCEFVPYKMELKTRGKSRKFWCRRTDEHGRYFNDRYEISNARIVSKEGELLDSAGQVLRYSDGSPQCADIIKVKYDSGGNRGREVYTEVAVSRFLWAIGFPADLMYRAQVWCRGCSIDPFTDIQSDAENRPVNETNFFPSASVERRVARSIETEPDQGFEWKEVYSNSLWSKRQRAEFEAYVLALNMVNFHNGRPKQNTVGCEEGAWDRGTGTCSQPIVFLDDLGATFGGGKSRGELERFRTNTVFRPTGACFLRSDLAGFKRVSEESRLLLTERLSIFDRELLGALFAAAGFDAKNTGAPTSEWVATFKERIEEVRSADCR